MYDTIIVGAGSAGCVLANRLSTDPARRVLLLEAGRAAPLASSIPANWGTMLNTSVDWSFHTEPQEGCKGRRLYWPRGEMVGGSSAMNAMIYIRGLPSDYNRWADEGATGWAWADVFPVFLRSEDNARFGNSPFHRAGGPLTISDAPYVDPTERLFLEAAKSAGLPANDDFNGAQQEGVGFYQLTVKDGERFGTGKAFLCPAQERPNLTLRTGVLAARVVLEHGRAVGVEFLENGRLQTAHASSEVVLSSGSIGSAQLLLLSGIGPARGWRGAVARPTRRREKFAGPHSDLPHLRHQPARRLRCDDGGPAGGRLRGMGDAPHRPVHVHLGRRWRICPQPTRRGGARPATLR
jgi:choline dehydrogenase